MTGLIAGTWSLISSSAEVIRSARGMTNRIQRLLQLEKNELSDSDRRRLLSLQKRVECLVQPLNFLLLWSKNRDSCVQQAVLNAQELLFDVCSYVERFVPSDGVLSTAGGKGSQASRRGSLDCEQLEYYLRELEFACASVSMAVSISRVIDTPPPQQPCQAPIQAASRSDETSVSLAALLKASRRIQDMKGHTGDLCACPGRLYYSQAVSSRSVPSTAPAVANVDPTGDGALRCEEEWSPRFSQATFKVVAYDDLRRGQRRYRISIDSRLPLCQRDCSRVAISREAGDDESRRGLNDDGPLVFPMEVALHASLMTTANMVLPAENKCLRDLGIDSIVLVWGAASSSSDAPVEASTEFPDAVFLPDTMPEIEGLPRSLQFATLSRREFSRTSLGRSASVSPGRYAFVFDGPRGTAEARAGEAEVALTPLDALYLARLCALDGDPATTSVADGSSSDGSIGACPPHLLSSDEVLKELLQASRLGAGGDIISAKAANSQTENGYGRTDDVAQVRHTSARAES